jgi:RHS repeat-associated protein
MRRGTLSGGTISNRNSTLIHDWPALDERGNWRTWRISAGGSNNPTYNTQTRVPNSANEIDVDNNDANPPGASITQTTGSGMNWIAPTYDKDGNLATGPKPGAETASASRLYFTYDAWNRLAKVQIDNGSGGAGAEQAEYQYDALHQRIVKLIPNGSAWNRTDYYQNGISQVMEERAATALANKTTVATVPSFQWVWDLRYQDAPILRDQNKDGDNSCIGANDQRLYYCNDANYNTTALVSTAGAVVERYAYTPYGQAGVFTAAWATQSQTMFSNEILFAGYRQNFETGLYAVRRRDFHPTLGSFLERDPMGYHDSFDLYEYVGSRPYLTTDPSGMFQLQSDTTPSYYQFTIGAAVYTVPWNMRWIQFTMMGNSSLSMQSIFAIAGLGGFCPVCNQTPPAAAPARTYPIDVAIIDSEGSRGTSSANVDQAMAVKWEEEHPNDRHVFGKWNYETEGPTWINTLKDFPGPKTCIRTIEVMGHANPWFIGGFSARIDGTVNPPTPPNIGNWAPKLSAIPWCSTCSIYLKGCDTGLTWDTSPPAYAANLPQQGGPTVMEVISGYVHCSVYGTRGYVEAGRAHFFGNMAVEKGRSTYVGAVDAEGDASWMGLTGNGP